MTLKRPILALALSLLLAGAVAAQETGQIEGQVTGDNGHGLSGVVVVVQGADLVAITDANGAYRIANVPAGTYTLTFTSNDNADLQENVKVTAGETTTSDFKADWDLSFVESITVFSASRRAEKITEAPAAVTIITAEKIEREASHGQLPKLLEFTPGAEVTQSGIYDYNFNTRGFNSSLNRRVATLIDGRDVSVPFLGAQEWAAIGFPLDDLANIELVRGPSAALYGSNASSGVLNMTTKAPRYNQGGTFRLAAGELSTLNADLRWADEVSNGWYYKLVGGVRTSGDFTVSRNGFAEYSVPCTARGQTDCLPQERVALNPENDDTIYFGGIRFDKDFGNGHLLTLEGGQANIEGPAFQTGIGRVQLVDISRPWARVNYFTPHWNVLAFYNGRDASDQTALSSGNKLVLDTSNIQIEVQTNWELGDKARIVAGGSYSQDDIDSRDPATGRQTLMFQAVDGDFTAAYAQLDWELSDKIKLVLAGRWDDSSLHDAQFSPKASLVAALNENHTLRFTYNEAFQVANYSEFFLQAAVAAPLNLSPFEGFCAPFGVSCGFGSGATPILAVGNESLEVEETQTFEVGYTGIFNNKAFLTVDYYNSSNTNFITDLIPQLGTGLGRVNPNFQPYAPPSSLPAPAAAGLLAALQGALGPSFFILSNNVDGTPILTAVSYANFGDVDTQGVDLGLNYYIDEHWNVSFSYSWFDFDILSNDPALSNILIPNTPENKSSFGVSYSQPKWDLGLSGRWVDSFRWSVGPFQGDVDSYTTFDLNGNYHFNDSWSAGINVSNLFDDKHFESFGGDLLSRRALANIAFNW